MRSLVLAVTVAAALALATRAARADEPVVPEPVPAPVMPAPPADDLPRRGHIDGVVLDPADLPITDLDTGQGRRRPSGFWTGYRPSRGGAYRWPLLIVGVALTALTTLLLVRMLRRASRARPS